jgi:hypothetical protein
MNSFESEDKHVEAMKEMLNSLAVERVLSLMVEKIEDPRIKTGVEMLKMRLLGTGEKNMNFSGSMQELKKAHKRYYDEIISAIVRAELRPDDILRSGVREVKDGVAAEAA